MRKRILSLLLALVLLLGLLPGLRLTADAANVTVNANNFPDANFRAFVKQYDKNNDNILSDAERNAVKTLDCRGKEIATLAGVEYFTELEYLGCMNNSLTSLNLSKNTGLKYLYCYDNDLTALNLAANTNLIKLNCMQNRLTGLDVSKCTKLTNLLCNENQLTTLDLANCTKLEQLDLGSNQISSLSISKNTKLMVLMCHDNPIKVLDLSANPYLKDAVLNGTKWSTPSLVSYQRSTDAGDEKVYVSPTTRIVTDNKSYPLIIAGVRVNEVNRDDILGNGVFSFDGVRTLTVNGSYTTDKEIIVNEGLRDLRIMCGKYSKLTSTGSNAMRILVDTTITGGSQLSLISEASGYCGIYVFADSTTAGTVTLTLEEANVMAKSSCGVSGPLSTYTSRTKLVIDHSTLLAQGPDGAVCDFGGGITLRNSRILTPVGGKPGSGNKLIVDAQGNVATNVLIGPETLVNPFVDVKSSDPFYDAVLWAYYHSPKQITNGTDATHFTPNKTVTRGQAVRFLWNAVGQPTPAGTKNPFTDNIKGKFYYDAVLWAYYNDPRITDGTTATTFTPNKTCNRAQIITFLWKAVGRPTPTIADPYTDLREGAYYTEAAIWAYQMGIEKGTNSIFDYNAPCTRAEIVLYLYRFYTGRDLVN